MKKNKKKLTEKLLYILNNADISKIKNNEFYFFDKKTILITGVSGIIGLNLLFFFHNLSLKKKINIKIEATYNSYLFDFVKSYFKKINQVKFVKIDLTNKKINVKKKYDIIFHCAGYGQPSKFLRQKLPTYKLNSNTLMDLKRNLTKNGKFIYMSTTEIYSGNNNLCLETHTGNTNTEHPRSSYIDSKKFGESLIINTFKKYLIFRVCLVYGPGVKLNDERVLNQVIMRSIRNKHIDTYGGLNQLRSNLYISDAINMMVKAIVKSENQILNINNNKMIKLGQIFSILSKLTKKKLIKHKSKVSGSPNIIKISNKKILNITKYKISTHLREGLLDTIKWYFHLIKLTKQ